MPSQMEPERQSLVSVLRAYEGERISQLCGVIGFRVPATGPRRPAVRPSRTARLPPLRCASCRGGVRREDQTVAGSEPAAPNRNA